MLNFSYKYSSLDSNLSIDVPPLIQYSIKLSLYQSTMRSWSYPSISRLFLAVITAETLLPLLSFAEEAGAAHNEATEQAITVGLLSGFSGPDAING